MKLIGLIIVLIGGIIYCAFFVVSNEVFRDQGSFREKHVVSKFGVKSVIVIENEISEFLSKEGITELESWVRTSSWLSGFIDRAFFYKDYKYKNEFLIRKLKSWLIKKLNSKKNDHKYIETNIKPTLLNFMERLKKDEYSDLVKIMENLDID